MAEHERSVQFLYGVVIAVVLLWVFIKGAVERAAYNRQRKP